MGVYSEYFEVEKEAKIFLRRIIENYDLQICSMVTFGYPTIYYIYRENLQNNYKLRVVQWNKYFDMDISQNPLMRLKFVGKKLSPTIIQKEIDFPDQKQTNKILLKFSRMNIPNETEQKGIKLDGTTYEVSLFNRQDQKELRYIWWEGAPKEWKVLEELKQETIEFFRNQSHSRGWIYI